MKKIKNLDNLKLTLMKTDHIPLGEIDKQFLVDINVKWDEISTMSLEIPNKIMIDGRVEKNNIYDLVRGKRQQIITSNPNIRFTITEMETKEESDKEYPYRIKTIRCESYESTLGKLLIGEDLVRQLYNNKGQSLDISEGYLDFFERDNPYWSVGTVSEGAMKELSNVLTEYKLSIASSITKTKVERKTVLWEKDFGINPISDKLTMNLKFMYNNVKTYDINNKLQYDGNMVHKLDYIHTGIRKIKAYYDKNIDRGSYDIFYEITLADGTTTVMKDKFTFMDGMKLECGNVDLFYTTGLTEEQMVIKYRMLEQGEYPWCDLLRKNLSTSFGNLYFHFDTINKVLNVCLKEEYGDNYGLLFSYDNFVKDINRAEIMDNIVSKLYVTSGQCSLSDSNKYGVVDYILNYDYFIEKDICTDELKDSWRRYDLSLDGKSEQLFELRLEKDGYSKELIKLESERTALDYTINKLQLRRTDYIANNKDGSFDTEIANLSTEINTKMARFEIVLRDIEVLKDKSSNVDVKLKDITSSMQLENATDSKGKIFNEELLEELHSLTIEGNIEDTTYFTSTSLYDYYTEELARRHRDYIDIQITAQGFLDNMIIAKGMQWENYIECGNFIYLEEIDDKGELKADKTMRIVEYTIDGRNEEVKDIRLTDQDKQPDDFSGISNMVQNVGRSKTYVKTYKELWSESRNVNDFINKARTEGMDLRASAIRSQNENVRFNFTENGLYCITVGADGNTDKQIYISGSMICVTKDKFQTVSTAIDSEGVNAKLLIGEIILGKQLFITSEDGQFYVGNIDGERKPNNNGKNFGIQIQDESGKERIFLGLEEIIDNGVKRKEARLTLKSKDGLETVLSEDGILNAFQFSLPDNLDSTHPMIIPFISDEGVNYYKQVILKGYNTRYRAFESGSASGGSVVTSSNGGGGTSASGGGGTSSWGGGLNFETLCDNASWYYATPVTRIANYPDDYFINGDSNSHSHEINTGQLRHNHTVLIRTDSHNHTMSSHQHQIYDHQHTLNTSHAHSLIYDIYESTMCSNMAVYVNDVLVKSGINGNEFEVDITSYLTKGQTNIIKITTSTNGRLVSNIRVKEFRRW